MSSNDNVNERVKAELISRKVKLWLPPYFSADGAGPDKQQLQRLASELSADDKLQDVCANDVLSALVHWQWHALEKKKEKRQCSVSVEIKLLGLREDTLLKNDDAIITPMLSSWAQEVEVSPKCIKLHHVDPNLTVSQVHNQLKNHCQASEIRLVHKGKSVVGTDQARLIETLGVKHKGVVLCLVSYKEEAAPLSPDHALIANIRNAATKLQGSANFEITDQIGNLVAMRHTERLALVTALGLHRLGRQRMMEHNDMTSALVFLLEADHEWKQISVEWQNKVDNYGLLQLDIGWAYLQLESLESLPDVTRRLEVAETVLRKQVHSNFVTLALVQAETGNPVPPLAAVFVRLFLLQGIAYRYSNEWTKSQERLDWAFGLCQSLRAVSNEDAVASLCEAIVGSTPAFAISALRRTNGDVNAAATLMEQDEQIDIQKRWERERQHRIGHCQNGMDLVNLDLIPQLQSILDLPSPVAASQDRAYSASQQQLMDANYKMAAGLLRLANNDLEKALTLHQETQGNSQVILQRVDALDRSLEEQGIIPKHNRERSREWNAEESLVVVDEIALATLESMGVDDELAKAALKKSSNNVEMALLWLSNQSNSGTTGEVTTTNTDVPNSEGGQDEGTARREIDEEAEAQNLLEQELAGVLQERDMEKEYLGNSLDEEWDFIEKFRRP